VRQSGAPIVSHTALPPARAPNAARRASSHSERPGIPPWRNTGLTARDGERVQSLRVSSAALLGAILGICHECPCGDFGCRARVPARMVDHHAYQGQPNTFDLWLASASHHQPGRVAEVNALRAR
jgi:hypothetical protein